MRKTIIKTEKAPAAIGPYSQAVKSHPLIFVSGQIPIDPATGNLITGDIKSQTFQVLRNLKEVLVEAGSSLEMVQKTTVFITDMDDFGAVNEIYGEFFPVEAPARSCVEVSKLPKGCKVEIEAIALVDQAEK